MAIELSPDASDSWRDYKRLRDQSVEVERPDLTVFRIFGRDWQVWLQGQVTQDVEGLTSTKPISFCFCSATGQLQATADLDLLQGDGGIVIEKARSQVLKNRVEKLVILEEVYLEDMTDEIRVVHVTGPLASLEGKRPIQAFENSRYGQPGWDIVIQANRKPLYPSVLDESLDLARLEAGIPVFGLEMGERTLPPEMGPDFETKYIHYSKGCYTGQEVLQRIHSRGHTNKTWVGLLAESAIEEGARVVNDHGDDIGVVLSVGHSPVFGFIGSAMLKNDDSEAGTTVIVQNMEGEVEAKVKQMPFFHLDEYPPVPVEE